MIIQILIKDINEHFDENGMFLVNKTDNKDKIRDDIKNKIVEEDEEKH